MMESMGITEEDLDAMSEQLGGMFGGENGEDFEPGGAGTFPFMQGLMDLNLQPGEMSETQEQSCSASPLQTSKLSFGLFSLYLPFLCHLE